LKAAASIDFISFLAKSKYWRDVKPFKVNGSIDDILLEYNFNSGEMLSH
jgi:hypothetical protein